MVIFWIKLKVSTKNTYLFDNKLVQIIEIVLSINDGSEKYDFLDKEETHFYIKNTKKH